MMECANEEPKQGQVSQEMNYLAEQIEITGNLLQDLEKRLNSILLLVPATCNDELGKVSHAKVALADCIAQQKSKVVDNNEKIRDITKRVEI